MKHLRRAAIAVVAAFTLFAIGRLEAKAPEGPWMVIVAAVILWVLVLAPRGRSQQR